MLYRSNFRVTSFKGVCFCIYGQYLFVSGLLLIVFQYAKEKFVLIRFLFVDSDGVPGALPAGSRHARNWFIYLLSDLFFCMVCVASSICLLLQLV